MIRPRKRQRKIVLLKAPEDAPPGETASGTSGNTHWVRFSLRDAAHRPLRKRAYSLLAGGRLYSGRTDANGAIAHEVPRQVTAATLSVWLDKASETPETTAVTIQPAGTKRDVLALLANLGFLRGDANDREQREARVRSAVASFQMWAGLEATGEFDTPTLQALKNAHHPDLEQSMPQSAFLPPSPPRAKRQKGS